MQLNNKTALVIGGGQTPGATIGNGRAVSLAFANAGANVCLLYTSPSPRDRQKSRMPSSA